MSVLLSETIEVLKTLTAVQLISVRELAFDLKLGENRPAVNSDYNALLGAKYKGIKVSAPGILKRVPGELSYVAKEMLENLEEMASRFYDGDAKAVDQFLQLYCLDDNRP